MKIYGDPLKVCWPSVDRYSMSNMNTTETTPAEMAARYRQLLTVRGYTTSMAAHKVAFETGLPMLQTYAILESEGIPC